MSLKRFVSQLSGLKHNNSLSEDEMGNKGTAVDFDCGVKIGTGTCVTLGVEELTGSP